MVLEQTWTHGPLGVTEIDAGVHDDGTQTTVDEAERVGKHIVPDFRILEVLTYAAA